MARLFVCAAAVAASNFRIASGEAACLLTAENEKQLREMMRSTWSDIYEKAIKLRREVYKEKKVDAECLADIEWVNTWASNLDSAIIRGHPEECNELLVECRIMVWAFGKVQRQARHLACAKFNAPPPQPTGCVARAMGAIRSAFGGSFLALRSERSRKKMMALTYYNTLEDEERTKKDIYDDPTSHKYIEADLQSWNTLANLWHGTGHKCTDAIDKVVTLPNVTDS